MRQGFPDSTGPDIPCAGCGTQWPCGRAGRWTLLFRRESEHNRSLYRALPIPIEGVLHLYRVSTNPYRRAQLTAHVPVFVPFRHGADRIGTMSALYRVAVQGWSKKKRLGR